MRFLISTASLLVMVHSTTSLEAQKFEPNYDESKIPAYRLPELLVTADGAKVDSADAWFNRRRQEVLRLFETHIYGRAPGRPFRMTFRERDVRRDALGGRATRKQVAIDVHGNGHATTLNLLLYVPNAAQPAPVFLGLNFRGNHTVHTDPEIFSPIVFESSGRGRELEPRLGDDEARGSNASRWPVELIVERGYALATMYYGDIDPDFDDGFRNGVHPLFYNRGQTQPAPDEWGAIAAWAWGLRRAADYLASDPDIDGTRMALLGHSRLGKTALWAGAQDERFGIVISNNSGCGGAALSRRRFGETVGRINTVFPHWFCANFKHFNEREDELPIDQHMLIALIAPRRAYVASAVEDRWADPHGEFLAAQHAEPVYRLLGHGSVNSAEQPPVDQPVGDFVGYHVRSGKHDVTRFDWERYLDFADRHFGGAAK